MTQLVVRQMTVLQLEFRHQFAKIFLDLVLGLCDDREALQAYCAHKLPLLGTTLSTHMEPAVTRHSASTCNESTPAETDSLNVKMWFKCSLHIKLGMFLFLQPSVMSVSSIDEHGSPNNMVFTSS